ncbi:MAG: HepT-like ribonuclease domain-containing protein [Thermoleophilia bacterium]
MKQLDDRRRLQHMLDYATEALDMLRGRERSDLELDRQLSLALVRLLEIVGEAAGRVTADVRTRHSNIPWADIVGLRNRLIHGYDSVDQDILWDILVGDLPPLVERLREVLADLQE